MVRYEFSGGLRGFLQNPSYIIRSQIYQSVNQYKHLLCGKILDFGCGEKPYKDMFSYEEYIGIDFEITGHDNKQNNIEYFWDGNRLPFEDNSIDSILATEVLEHVFNLDTILMEFNRVLKPHGKILITIPFMVGEHEEPFDFARYTYFGIEHIVKQYNFGIDIHDRLGTNYSTILQLIRWNIAQWIYSFRSPMIRILLNGIIGLPAQILLNTLFLVDFSKNQQTYLNNFLILTKNESSSHT